MNKSLFFLLPLLCCSCVVQNQLILDPLAEGESLMIRDEAAIATFETIMAGVADPTNTYKLPESTREFFNSADVISTFQDTQPVLGICRNGDKEYYYHIERNVDGTLITDLDDGVTDYIITPEKYKEIQDFMALHTPPRDEEEESDEQKEEPDEEE
ncbi:MAG: hypothetical protein IKY92_03190 [Akkermansia sp.]|nr:hypothetical protein [Akkermansia sp.]